MCSSWKTLTGAGITLFVWWLFASGKLVLVPRDPTAPIRQTVESMFDEVPRRAGDRVTGAARWVDKGAPVGMSQAFLTTGSAREVQEHFLVLLTQAGWSPDRKFDRQGKYRTHAKYCRDGYSFTISTERRENQVLYTTRMFWTRDRKSEDYCPTPTEKASVGSHRNTLAPG